MSARRSKNRLDVPASKKRELSMELCLKWFYCEVIRGKMHDTHGHLVLNQFCAVR